jgi:2,4-dienoyl-CoA reductase-like NADH-dependent reductase (Old Yellow Enzyme family)
MQYGMDTTPLFRPSRLKKLELANRIAMAPMTRCFSPGGVPAAGVAEYYRKRAEGGVGLIVTEGTTIYRKAASDDPAIPNFHEEASLKAWRVVIDEVHAAGGNRSSTLASRPRELSRQGPTS